MGWAGGENMGAEIHKERSIAQDSVNKGDV